MSVLEVRDITKSYGDLKAVDHVTFQAENKRIYGVLGPNGAGKTTIIRMIMNILVPDSGTIMLFRQKMNDDLKRRIGYLPEERGLYTKMKVIDMLIFLGKLHVLSTAEAVANADIWLNRLELSQWRNNKIEELSKGMQQKIQFIGTIMHNPELIILDEPFSGLDPINTQLIKDIMLNLREQGASIMFSTHLMDAAEKICDDIMLINKGKIVLDGKLADIKKQHGRQTIQIEYDGDGEFLKSQSMIENFNDYGNYVEVVLQEEYDPNELLKVLVEKFKIRRFECTTSSLNEIFLETVGRNQNVKNLDNHMA